MISIWNNFAALLFFENGNFAAMAIILCHLCCTYMKVCGFTIYKVTFGDTLDSTTIWTHIFTTMWNPPFDGEGSARMMERVQLAYSQFCGYAGRERHDAPLCDKIASWVFCGFQTQKVHIPGDMWSHIFKDMVTTICALGFRSPRKVPDGSKVFCIHIMDTWM